MSCLGASRSSTSPGPGSRENSILSALAGALGVAPGALADHGTDDPAEAFQALTELEGCGMGARPVATEDGPAVAFSSAELNAYLGRWLSDRMLLEAGELSPEEYALRRDRIGMEGEA